MRANETFLYAFGFGSESELRRAGGLAALFPQSANGVLIAKASPKTAVRRLQRASSRSGQVTTLAISRSGRQRTFHGLSQCLNRQGSGANSYFARRCPCTWGTRTWAAGGRMDIEPICRARRPRTVRPPILGRTALIFWPMSVTKCAPRSIHYRFSELMKDERFGAVDANKFREYASDIHTSAMHALSLINDLLDITKIIAGKSDLEFEAVALNACHADRQRHAHAGQRSRYKPENGLASRFAEASGGSAQSQSDFTQPVVQCHQVYRKRRGGACQLKACRGGRGAVERRG